MNGELLSILATIERDKGIDREILIQTVEAALATAAKKSLGGGEEREVSVTLDRKTGQLIVIADGREIDSAHFSRIAAQTARQVMIQKLREAEREVIFTEFQERVGDIMTGTVHRFERGDIIVDVGRAEAIVPKSDRIPHEDYHQGERLQGYVSEVRKNAKGPSIVLSRTHPGFVQGLFTLEVPEISEGIVAIKGIAREAGDRTKIAVTSKDEKVDAVGACVGMRGNRVKNIVRELHGEKIDIVRWHEKIEEFIAAALSPAKIASIEIAPDAKQAMVTVDDDQLSLAIGKKGQNVRLASKLTGWELEINSRSQLTQAAVSLHDLPGLGPAMQTRLKDAGVKTLQQLASMSVEQLTQIKGIGEKTAQKLLVSAHQALNPSTQPPTETPAVAEASSSPAPSEETPSVEPATESEDQPTTEPPEETEQAG